MFEQAKRPQLKAPEPGRPASAPLKPATQPATPMPNVSTRPLEPPPRKKQGKPCPACEEEGTTCAGCQKKAAPALERPPASTQMRRGTPGEDPAERQADELGKDIGEELKGTESVGHGPMPKSVQDVAETHLGVSLAGTYIDAGSSGQKKAKNESARAVTEGGRIAFGEGQLDTSTSEGRALLGHELVHVGQQAQHGAPARQRAADPLQASIGKADAEGLDDKTLVSEIVKVRSRLLKTPKEDPIHSALRHNLGVLEKEYSKRSGTHVTTIPVSLTFQIVGEVGKKGPPTVPPGLVGTIGKAVSAPGILAPTRQREPRTTAVPAILPGAGFGLGYGMAASAEPIPLPGLLPRALQHSEAGVYTRFANSTEELAPRLGWRLDPAARAVFAARGITEADLKALQQALSTKGVSGLTPAEMDLFRRAVETHATVEGATPMSPLLSLTEHGPADALALETFPEVAKGRTYIVRVRLNPEDVARVNDVLGTERSAALVNELEVLVWKDLSNPEEGAKILSITANPASKAAMGGLVGGLLRWGGRAMIVVSVATTSAEILTAHGRHKNEEIGRAAGGLLGGAYAGAFATGLCIGLGVATAGAAVILCGVAGGLLGAFGGSAIGGEIGSGFD